MHLPENSNEYYVNRSDPSIDARLDIVRTLVIA